MYIAEYATPVFTGSGPTFPACSPGSPSDPIVMTQNVPSPSTTVPCASLAAPAASRVGYLSTYQKVGVFESPTTGWSARIQQPPVLSAVRCATGWHFDSAGIAV